jgi:dihydrofolate reductase
MTITAILAVDIKNGLAKNGKIPWKNTTDLTFFKNTTLNHTIIMGTKTLLSFPKEKPLSQRKHCVFLQKLH